jgi:hypothetical protein
MYGMMYGVPYMMGMYNTPLKWVVEDTLITY